MKKHSFKLKDTALPLAFITLAIGASCMSLKAIRPFGDSFMIESDGYITLWILLCASSISTVFLALSIKHIPMLLAIIVAATGLIDYWVIPKFGPLYPRSPLIFLLIGQAILGLYLNRANRLRLGIPFCSKGLSLRPLYNRYSVPEIKWVWHQRALCLINKLALFADIALLFFPLYFIYNSPVSASMNYLTFWFCFYFAFVLPLLLLESIGRFTYSVWANKKPGCQVEETKSLGIEINEKIIHWIKAGFLPEDRNT